MKDAVARAGNLLVALTSAGLLVAACSHAAKAPLEAKGDLRQMNLGAWTPEPAALKGPLSPYPLHPQTAER